MEDKLREFNANSVVDSLGDLKDYLAAQPIPTSQNVPQPSNRSPETQGEDWTPEMIKAQEERWPAAAPAELQATLRGLDVAQARLDEAKLWVSSEDEMKGGLNEHQLCPESVACLFCDKKRARIAELEAALAATGGKRGRD